MAGSVFRRAFALVGAGFRFLMWLSFVLVGIAMTMWYASRIKRAPARSLSAAADAYFREDVVREGARRELTTGHWLVIGTFFAGILWIIWGVTFEGYFIPEIASQFFTMGIVIGAIGAAFRLNGIGINDIAQGFKQGLADMAPSAAVVGMARGIMLILGSDDPAVPSVLNTLLNSAGVVLTDLPQMLAALGGVFAALALFVDKGFAATRLDDVAARAGVSKGTLYLYFSSKEALFKAVIEDGMVAALAAAEERLAGLVVANAKGNPVAVVSAVDILGLLVPSLPILLLVGALAVSLMLMEEKFANQRIYGYVGTGVSAAAAIRRMPPAASLSRNSRSAERGVGRLSFTAIAITHLVFMSR